MAKKREPENTPLWEKLVGLTGFILLSIVIGVLVRNVISGDETPPELSFEIINIVDQQNGFRVDVEVVNTGGVSVSDLEVEGHVRQEDGSTEISSLRFDYLPGHSRRTGGLFFATDPRNGNLAFQPKSFVEP